MDYQEIFYPETKFGGFTRIDGTIAFYIRVAALVSPEFTLLDYGCGRGRYKEDSVEIRRNLRIFQGKVKKVIGVDIDVSAAKNPYIDEFRLIENSTWPLEDNSIDICVCDWVLEHLEDPHAFFSEAKRVIRAGGYLCIRTSNKWGYAGIFSRMIPNRFHARVLDKVQKDRKTEDVYPTFNNANTPGKVRSLLESHGFNCVVYTHESEPAYLHFSKVIYWFGVLFQKVAPSIFRRTIMAFAQNMNK